MAPGASFERRLILMVQGPVSRKGPGKSPDKFLETPVTFGPFNFPGNLPGNLREVVTSFKVTGESQMLQKKVLLLFF